MGVLSKLEPREVFAYFEALCAVPHGSGNTAAASDLCVAFAEAHGLRCRREPCGNVIIWKAASPGHEQAAPVMLQGHLDMVCAKTDDCPKDMTKEGLDLRTDGTWVWADQTSLGGDDGIAVAMMLAILADDTLVHPPLEAVFTVEEETGMDGAAALDVSDLKSRRLLNLDSEQEGVFTVSCAGGLRSECFLPAELTPADGMESFTLTVAGLRGGHSGADIHRGRGSALQLMARVLYAAAERFPGLRLAALDGGQFDNVICSCCTAAAALPVGQGAAFTDFVRAFAVEVQNEYAVTDPGVTLTCAPAAAETAVDSDRTLTLLRALAALPQGVEAMDTDFPGLVQTSMNIGVAHLTAEGLCVTCSLRSSVSSRKEMLAARVRAIMALAGGTVTEHGRYPGWQYRRQSAFRDTVIAAYQDVTGREAVVEATHGGLECGLLIDKLPGLDAVSLGPDIPDIHSVREKLSVASTARVYAAVREALRRSV